MINPNEFEYLYKYEFDDNKNLKQCRTNVLYAPSMSDTNFLMDWSKDYNYHPSPQDYVISDWFFDREVRMLEYFQYYQWCPKISDIDIDDRKLVLNLSGESLNHLIFKHKTLNEKCPDWKKQIKQIVNDIESHNHYKIALYPHCFFLDNGIIKTVDFYSCVNEKDRYIPLSRIAPIIGENSETRYKKSTVNETIDTLALYDITVREHLDKVWHENPLADV